jgi:hypothetical protein
MTKVSDDLIMHRPIGDIELDPALDVLPLMARDDFARLVDSVSRDGITHPLHVREEGQRIICLDGRNRLKAAPISLSRRIRRSAIGLETLTPIVFAIRVRVPFTK